MPANLSTSPATPLRQQVAPDLPLSASVKYNPHLWGDNELRAIFVVRRQELETLLAALRACAADSVPQHILITGHRGMGKSTLLRRVALAVREAPDLCQDWLALNFPEEQYTVSNLTEFWRNVLDALTDTLERQGCPPPELARLDAAIAGIEDLPVAAREDAALALLRDCIEKRGQRILLLIDSTDQLFAGLAGGGTQSSGGKGVTIRDAGATPLWRLRKTLSHDKGIFWLGASYQALEAQHQYHDAFHDFFQLLELRSLTVAEMREAMLALARTFGMGHGLQGEAATTEMARVLDSRPERLKAMHAMTGGNPRTTVMLYDLFAAGGDGNVHNDLRGLLDMMTPLYKARMETLAEQPRKILAHLMELWAPQPVRMLAAAAGIAATTVSGQLSRLEGEGLVEKVSLPGGKRTGYQVAERFFNVWYLMRYASRRLRQRLTWLVEFMRLWFSADELADLAHARSCRHGGGQMCDETGLEYSRALAAALPQGHRERYRLEWSVFSAAQDIGRDARRMVRELFDLEGDDREFATANDYLERFRALDAGLARCPHAENVDEWIEAVKGSFLLTLADKEMLAAADLSRSEYDSLLAILMDELRQWARRYPEATVEVVHQAVCNGRFFPDCPETKLAYSQLLTLFSDHPLAFSLALELCPKTHGGVWLEQGYRQVIELDGSLAQPWNGLGNLFMDHLQRYDEAEAAYRQAITLDGTWATPWNGLGNLLQAYLKRYDEAETAYSQAIALDGTDAYPWYSLGNLFVVHLQRYDEAEAAYRQAIALNGTWAFPWNDMGNLFMNHLKRYDEAESAFRQAIELAPDNLYPVANLARLLVVTGQPEAAASHFRQVAAMVATGEEAAGFGLELVLQAQLWLGNSDAAIQALEALASQAAAGDQWAFFRLREQAWECHQLGIALALAGLMEQGIYADFLKPISLALRATGVEGKELLAEAPPEVAMLAAEIRAEIERYGGA